MDTPAVVIGSVACLIAVTTDLAWRRVPNWLTIPLVVVALVTAGVEHGWRGFAAALLVACAALAAGFFPYAMGLLGAGDVKLFAGVAALAGYPATLDLALFTGVAGGVLAAIIAVSRGELRAIVTRLFARFKTSLVTGGLATAIAEKSSARLPYALAIGAGFAAVAAGNSIAPLLRIVQ